MCCICIMCCMMCCVCVFCHPTSQGTTIVAEVQGKVSVFLINVHKLALKYHVNVHVLISHL